MFRQAETNLKWMLTISLLFHATILSLIFSSGIFKRSGLFTARHSPLSSIQVSIVNLSNEYSSVKSVPQTEVAKVEKAPPYVKKMPAMSVKKEAKQVTKNEKLREVKENRGETPDETPAIARPSAENTSAGMNAATPAKEAKIATGAGPMASGPVVDMPSFKYDYYLGLIKNKVDNRWNQPVTLSKTRRALIEFTINRRGDVSNARVADSSGDSYFDQTALRAVTLSTPFPPLPKGFKGNSLRVHYRFIFGEKG